MSPSLASIHDVFYVSMLNKYVLDLRHVVKLEPLRLREDLNKEHPIQIVDHKDHVLQCHIIHYVKAQQSHHSERKAA